MEMDIRIWNRQIKPALVGLSTTLKTKSIFLGIVCPDLTNSNDKIPSKNGMGQINSMDLLLSKSLRHEK